MLLWNSVDFLPKTRKKYIHTAPGLTRQRNRGIDTATGDILYFFDDDTILKPEYLATMQDTFTQFPHYIGGMGNVTNIAPYRLTPHRIFKKIFFHQHDYGTGNFTLSGVPTHVYGTQKFRTIKTIGGCCMSFRKKLFEHERFDEKLNRYGYLEDADLARRAGKWGTLFYQPSARLEHHHSPLNRDAIVDNRAMFIANSWYLFFKNEWPEHKIKFVPFVWSNVGYVIEAAVFFRSRRHLMGFFRGLYHALKHRAQQPWP